MRLVQLDFNVSSPIKGLFCVVIGISESMPQILRICDRAYLNVAKKGQWNIFLINGSQQRAFPVRKFWSLMYLLFHGEKVNTY